MQSQMTAIANRSRTINGVPTSLSDIGYIDVGLDDNWQACGSYGPNGYSFHDANGRPVVNQQRFPDFLAMTNYAHSLGLTSGWYGNNCICSDHCSSPECYQGDVDAAIDYGFDSIKLDGCGAQRDLDLYAALFNASGKSILIENCHWGGTVPNATWCPWNYFRSSGDIGASYGSIVSNLQTTIQWAQQGLSRPGCWAYPDMLEVGCHGLPVIESRSHFNAWCIVSSPLILSMDMLDDVVMDQVWPIITNAEALAVSQNYVGEAGTVFKSSPTKVKIVGATEGVPQWQFWSKKYSSSATAVLLMNHDGVSHDFTLTFADVPGLDAQHSYKIRDINAHADLGAFTGSWAVTNVTSHDAVFLSISPA
jgi:hypothetical protein